MIFGVLIFIFIPPKCLKNEHNKKSDAKILKNDPTKVPWIQFSCIVPNLTWCFKIVERQLIYFLILSIFSRNVLSVPVSTISESVFSLSGRILDSRRMSLMSEMVECLTCLSDWELAFRRAQYEPRNSKGNVQIFFKYIYRQRTGIKFSVNFVICNKLDLVLI